MSDIEVEPAPLSPHNDGLLEAGKKLLLDSIDVGRDFCKTMVGVATGAIPIYLALLGLAVGKDYRPSVGVGALLLAAPIVFLGSAGAFARGYFPTREGFSLDLPEDVERVRSKITDHRYKWALGGSIAFAVGVVCAIAAVTYALTIDSSPSKTQPAAERGQAGYRM